MNQGFIYLRPKPLPFINEGKNQGGLDAYKVRDQKPRGTFHHYYKKCLKKI
jgi:hypothetical protein